MKARIRDTEIFFDVEGVGLVVDAAGARERPTAFLVHGGPGVDHVGTKHHYSALADRFQLVYFDHRGHGRSARGDPAKYHLDENVEDMEALRRHLGLDRIASIGASYGGRVAMAHAARYPDAVSHLVLIATTANAPESAVRASEIVKSCGTPEQVEQCAALYAGSIDTPEKLRRYFQVMGPLYSKKYRPEFAAGHPDTILEPAPLNRAYGPEGFLWKLDLRPELARITAPTLILSGRHDFRCAPEFSVEMHDLIKGSELVVFDNSAHAIMRDEPQRALDAIRGFIACR